MLNFISEIQIVNKSGDVMTVHVTHDYQFIVRFSDQCRVSKINNVVFNFGKSFRSGIRRKINYNNNELTLMNVVSTDINIDVDGR